MQGWFGPVGAGEYFKAVKPRRVLDSRTAGIKLEAGAELAVKVTGIGGVPSTATAVVLNVTATDPDADGYLTVYPAGVPLPLASNVNDDAGQTIPNVVVSGVSADGRINIFAYRRTHVVVDVAGWFGA